MTNGNTDALTELQAIAAEASAALDTCRQISPFSARLSAFNLDDAYRVTAAIRQMRERRGEMPVGRKIGFTNRTVWAEYGPIWGYVYNRTVHNLAEIGGTSVAVLDALNTCEFPILEVHITNIHRREEFRHHSFVSRVAQGVICGFGTQGYLLAIQHLAELIGSQGTQTT